MSATLSGPATGVLYSPSTFTVTQSAPFTGIITLSDASNGIFAPEQLQWSNSSQTLTFAYIPNSTGTISITATSTNETISGSPASISVTANVATSVLFTSPTIPSNSNQDVDLTVGTASGNFTVTPNGLLTGTIVPWDGGQGGTFTPSSLTFSGTSTAQTFTYTPVAVNSKVKISLRLPSGFSPVNQFTCAIQPAVATSVTFSWASSTVQAGKAVPTPLVITPNGTYTGTLTLSDGASGTFWPGSKIVLPNPTNAPINIWYTPAIATTGGTRSVTLTASPSVTITGSPISVPYNPVTPFANFGPGVYNPFYYPNPTNS